LIVSPRPVSRGDERDPVEMQADLVVQLCSNVRFVNYDAGKRLLGD